MTADREILVFAIAQEWRAWLTEHHATATAAWLVLCKKGATKQGLRYEEAVEEALCFGWIDGLARSRDAETFTVRFTPRRSDSIWAESNKRRVQRLIDEGRMTSAGLAKVSEAKASGEWQAATRREDVDAIPPDLEAALRERDTAWVRFSEWAPSHKKQYLYWLESAKRPETRQKRIQAIVEKAVAKGDTVR